MSDIATILLARIETLAVELATLKRESSERISALDADVSYYRERTSDLSERLDGFYKLEDKLAERDREINRLHFALRDAEERAACLQHDLNAAKHPIETWGPIADAIVANTHDYKSQKIAMIKEFRTKVGCGLREAKDAIETAMAKVGGRWSK